MNNHSASRTGLVRRRSRQTSNRQSRSDTDLRMLHPDERKLVEIMREIAWGRIEKLPIRNGLPRMTSRVKRLKYVRSDRPTEVPQYHPHSAKHKLKNLHRDMFKAFRRLGRDPVAWEIRS